MSKGDEGGVRPEAGLGLPPSANVCEGTLTDRS